MKLSTQTTLRESVSLSGAGVHSGRLVNIHLHPAVPNHGVVFLRTGLPSGRNAVIEARHVAVTATELCTVLGERESGTIATVEHLMSALAGLGVDNVLVEVDGPEMPILDGSAAPFVAAIDGVGLASSRVARRYVKVLKPVRAERGQAYAELGPAESGFSLDVEIDFQNLIVGRQRKVIELAPAIYRREVCRARTFGFIGDVERLWKAGFALGASLDNTVAIDDAKVMNPEGLRFADEFVRHKMLDAIGDLALAGLPIVGAYRSYCSGHRLNVAALEELFADTANYMIVDGAAGRTGLYGQTASRLSAAAYAPDMR